MSYLELSTNKEKQGKRSTAEHEIERDLLDLSLLFYLELKIHIFPECTVLL